MIIILDESLKIKYATQKLVFNLRQLIGINLKAGDNLKEYGYNENIKLINYTIQEILHDSNFHRIPIQIPVADDLLICSIDPIPDSKGMLTDIILTFALANAEELIQENRKLKQANQNSNDSIPIYKGLLEILINDLHGSLNNIIMMSSNEFNKEEHLEFIPNIHQSAQYCDSTVNGILSLISNNTDPNMDGIRRIGLLEFVQEIIDEQKNNWEVTPEISLSIDHKEDVRFIKPFLKSVFQNLFQNAFDNRSAKRKLHIDISSKVEENYLCVTIKDNGNGIDLKKYGHLLHKPFKNAANKKKNGHGTGLYLVHSIMEMTEGKVSIASEVDKGTTFQLYFPL